MSEKDLNNTIELPWNELPGIMTYHLSYKGWVLSAESRVAFYSYGWGHYSAWAYQKEEYEAILRDNKIKQTKLGRLVYG